MAGRARALGAGRAVLTVACVWTGTKYPIDYVKRLFAGVARHLSVPFHLMVIADHRNAVQALDEFSDEVGVVETRLPGWFAKMELFNTRIRGGDRWLYFDLDTVLIRSIDPLAQADIDFGICANFTRRSGNDRWPCGYGSCCITLAPGYGDHIWRGFLKPAPRGRDWMHAAKGNWGDQWVIEQLDPHATLLQDVMPPGFFIGRRELTDTLPDRASVVVFAGNQRPDNSPHRWVAEHWR